MELEKIRKNYNSAKTCLATDDRSAWSNIVIVKDQTNDEEKARNNHCKLLLVINHDIASDSLTPQKKKTKLRRYDVLLPLEMDCLPDASCHPLASLGQLT